MKNTAVLLSSSPIALARKGVMAAVTQFLVAHNANVLHADDHIDSGRELFLSRMEWDLRDFDIPRDDFDRQFRPVADAYQ
ncbi:MAG TPA: formyltetrahydrofolate deformylase, partial [Candidatus Angelobacter sp.]|nr:formyltetrahydrofolate deformylase [Candidatus Angelobacter sp.]